MGSSSLTSRLVRSLGRTLRRAATGALAGSGRTTARGPAPAPPRSRRTDEGAGRSTYPGDFRGRPPMSFAPHPDDVADPGEIVWTWVPFEDDPSQGKDRPVLVVGRNGRTLLGLMLSSQSERDGRPNWLALGPGGWDREARPSWVRLDRILEVDEDGIRREGAVLDRARFDKIAGVLRRDHGWA